MVVGSPRLLQQCLTVGGSLAGWVGGCFGGVGGIWGPKQEDNGMVGGKKT